MEVRDMSIQMGFMKQKFHSNVPNREELASLLEKLILTSKVCVSITHVQLAAADQLPYEAHSTPSKDLLWSSLFYLLCMYVFLFINLFIN
jgi:hypothetical protein